MCSLDFYISCSYFAVSFKSVYPVWFTPRWKSNHCDWQKGIWNSLRFFTIWYHNSWCIIGRTMSIGNSVYTFLRVYFKVSCNIFFLIEDSLFSEKEYKLDWEFFLLHHSYSHMQTLYECNLYKTHNRYFFGKHKLYPVRVAKTHLLT